MRQVWNNRTPRLTGNGAKEIHCCFGSRSKQVRKYSCPRESSNKTRWRGGNIERKLPKCLAAQDAESEWSRQRFNKNYTQLLRRCTERLEASRQPTETQVRVTYAPTQRKSTLSRRTYYSNRQSSGKCHTYLSLHQGTRWSFYLSLVPSSTTPTKKCRTSLDHARDVQDTATQLPLLPSRNKDVNHVSGFQRKLACTALVPCDISLPCFFSNASMTCCISR